MNSNIALLIIFFAIIIIVLAFLSFFYISIKDFRKFSPNIFVAFHYFLIFLAIISLVIIYKIITGKTAVYDASSFDISTNVRQDF